MTDPAQTAKTTRLPARIGPYEVLGELGRGGMAETFRAVRRRPGGFEKFVCIKRVLYPHSADDDFRKQFQEEARILAQLNHSNIVQAYDYDQDDGLWYIVMELVDGVDASKLLKDYHRRGRRLPPGVAAHIGAEIAAALHYLHTFVDADGVVRNIVHRDVSPSNVLISRGGDVKLLDLGIAAYHGRPKLTRSDTIKGKTQYMSPEHIERGLVVDAQSDLFSLGILLYEALAGERPFDRHTESATFNAILTGHCEPLLSKAPYLDPELAGFVHRLLSVDKAARPSDAREAEISLRALGPHPAPKTALANVVPEVLKRATGNGGDGDGDGDGDAERETQNLSANDPLASGRAIAAAFRDPALAIVTAPRRTRNTGAELPEPVSQQQSSTGRAHPSWFTRRRSAVLIGIALAATTTAGWFTWGAPAIPSATPPAERSAPAKTSPAAPQPKASATPVFEPPASSPADAGALLGPSFAEETRASPDLQDRTTVLDDARDSRTRRKRTETGALHVRVLNWGYVWIDGVAKGKAPVHVDQLSAGTHEIGVSQDPTKPERVEKVRIEPGATTERVIHLDEGSFR